MADGHQDEETQKRRSVMHRYRLLDVVFFPAGKIGYELDRAAGDRRQGVGLFDSTAKIG